MPNVKRSPRYSGVIYAIQACFRILGSWLRPRLGLRNESLYYCEREEGDSLLAEIS